MPFDVYTAMGALVRAEACRTTTPSLPATPAATAPSASSAEQLPSVAKEFGGGPTACDTDRARRRPSARSSTRPSALSSALRRLAARLG
ncbi:hypothetical protein OG618_05435 [Kitasatospora sp. NBC_01246]|uniref:hypothetical protein n=1 Tax=Kitasatospora sp. NBC_01246 TaxID=2903570 RepID=UPI002E3393A1|nr:hypothetical protein [Kitasatospora sp. NBC_01246]